MKAVMRRAERNYAALLRNRIAVAHAEGLPADSAVRRAVEAAKAALESRTTHCDLMLIALEHDSRCVWPGTEQAPQVEANGLDWVVRSAARRLRVSLETFYVQTGTGEW